MILDAPVESTYITVPRNGLLQYRHKRSRWADGKTCPRGMETVRGHTSCVILMGPNLLHSACKYKSRHD